MSITALLFQNHPLNDYVVSEIPANKHTNDIEISLYKHTNDTVEFLCIAVVISSGVQLKIRNIVACIL